mmetsp:Transcript_17001/g.39246  ORF Transcript_17001/g.39246 Transcript_17001/m.39246 type:complete len:260 (+) Transcript_17001:240-1019(+)
MASMEGRKKTSRSMPGVKHRCAGCRRRLHNADCRRKRRPQQQQQLLRKTMNPPVTMMTRNNRQQKNKPWKLKCKWLPRKKKTMNQARTNTFLLESSSCWSLRQVRELDSALACLLVEDRRLAMSQQVAIRQKGDEKNRVIWTRSSTSLVNRRAEGRTVRLSSPKYRKTRSASKSKHCTNRFSCRKSSRKWIPISPNNPVLVSLPTWPSGVFQPMVLPRKNPRLLLQTCMCGGLFSLPQNRNLTDPLVHGYLIPPVIGRM